MKGLCEEIYIQTKQEHHMVDNHPFLKKSLKTKDMDWYISLIEQVLYLLDEHVPEEISFIKRPIRGNHESNHENPLFLKIKKDLEKDNLCLNQIYLWYLSLMAGGRMLKKYTRKDSHYLFDYSQEDKLNFKDYINSKVKDLAVFIDNTKGMYKLIKEHFDVIDQIES